MDTSFALNSKQSLQNTKKQYSISELQCMQKEVRFCIGILSTHCLPFATKWASELLISINKQIANQTKQHNDDTDHDHSHEMKDHKSNKNGQYIRSMTQLSDMCMLAKSYFDLKDYNRVIDTLKNEDFNTNNYAFFLSAYALYLLGEKTKEEEILQSNNQLDKTQVINQNLTQIIAKINKRELNNNNLDGFHYYIKGVCLRELNRDTEAIQSLIKSVNIFPYNWSAWRSLSELVINEKIFISVKSKLFNHWICSIFVAEVMVETTEFYNPCEVIQYFNNLSNKLAENTHILGQKALILYNLRKYEECMLIFSEILGIDAHHIELLDVYSNILYVREEKKQLSYLAHRCMANNKYRAETCCVVGNYYAMYGMHEKAILYFERSLSLNNNFISSYVLMGHEYIEMRNETAAIQCYRKSIDLNCRDYRGWYGLGQTYELLQMYTYSIFYYNKVCKLRPYDHRMWMALASCYKSLGNVSMSIKSYERAKHIAHNNNEGNKNVVLELAKLYNITKQVSKAKKMYKKYVAFIASPNKLLTDNEIEAFIKLSEIALNENEFGEAVKFAQRIIKYGQKGKETANKILQQIRVYQLNFAKGGKQKNSNHGMMQLQLESDNVADKEEEEDEDDGDDMEISYIN